MGISRYKKTSTNEYGETTTFLFCYNRSCDIGTLFVKQKADQPQSKYEQILTLTDDDLYALVDVLTNSQPIESISEEETQLH